MDSTIIVAIIGGGVTLAGAGLRFVSNGKNLASWIVMLVGVAMICVALWRLDSATTPQTLTQSPVASAPTKPISPDGSKEHPFPSPADCPPGSDIMAYNAFIGAGPVLDRTGASRPICFFGNYDANSKGPLVVQKPSANKPPPAPPVKPALPVSSAPAPEALPVPHRLRHSAPTPIDSPTTAIPSALPLETAKPAPVETEPVQKSQSTAPGDEPCDPKTIVCLGRSKNLQMHDFIICDRTGRRVFQAQEAESANLDGVQVNTSRCDTLEKDPPIIPPAGK